MVDDGAEPVADEELLYRRVPASTGWYDPTTGVLRAEAFIPHRNNDETGLSVSRSKYKSIEEAGQGRPGKSYFVAVLRAKDLRENGIQVHPCPLPEDPGHAELPDLTSANRKNDLTLERARLLAETLTQSVQGPFGSSE